MIYVRFSDGVVNDPQLAGRVKEIIDAANRTYLVGEPMWTTLVYSGVALGVESAQKYILEQIRVGAQTFRSTVDELDQLTLLLTDEDAIQKVKSISDVIKAGLKQRVDAATSIQAAESSKVFGLSEQVLLDDGNPREIASTELQKIGVKAAELQKGYFSAWMYLRRVGLLSDMKCLCHQCVGSKLPRDKPIDHFEEVSMLIDAFDGDYGAGLEEFAISVIEDQRKTLLQVIELGSPHGGGESASADAMMRNVMESLRLGVKPSEPPK